MYPSAETLCLSIVGIDNAFEASGLIRLFHPAEPVLDPTPDGWQEDLPASLGAHAVVVRLEVKTDVAHFSCTVRVFRYGHVAGTGNLSFDRSTAPGKADLLLKSPKLAAGTALYFALEEAFGRSLPWGSLTGVRPVKLASSLLAEGFRDREAVDVLVVRTGMSRQKAELIVSVAIHEKPFLEIPDKSVSLYVGIPFCATRCLYCSFPAYAVEQMGHLIPSYLDALQKEIQFLGNWLSQRHMILSTVYIGGGTPSALDANGLSRLFEMLAHHLPISGALEYTVEAGRPDTLNPEKLSLIREAGATRISINPQSMQDGTLLRIGRAHSAADVVEAFAQARAAGFDNINADLIAGLPGESRADFQSTLRQMQLLSPESLTVHTLAVKRASRLNEQLLGGMPDEPTDDETVSGMLSDAAAYARKNRLEPYYLYRQKNILANLENVGYALRGAGCRYNVETMSEKQTILAVGAGAITKISHGGQQLERSYNVRELQQYVSRIEEMINKKKDLLGRHFQA